jgi:hypothetical protein
MILSKPDNAARMGAPPAVLLCCLSCVQAEEPVSSVVLLAQHLEASNLQDFWAAANSCKDTIKQGGDCRMCWTLQGQECCLRG